MNKAPADAVKEIFDRLRAQLCGQVEALGLPKEQENATKRLVKDRTSEAWNKITDLVNTLTISK